METHENIKRLRDALGLSQEVLAEKVGYTDRSSIAKIEAGKVDLTQSKIAAFAAALNVTPAQLMGFDSSDLSAQKNLIKLVGRDGSVVIKELTDAELAAYKTFVDKLPEVDDL